MVRATLMIFAGMVLLQLGGTGLGASEMRALSMRGPNDLRKIEEMTSRPASIMKNLRYRKV